MSAGEEGDGDAEPVEIEDPEGYVAHRRLKSIFDIRSDIHTARQQVRLEAYGDRYQALCAYRTLLDGYIMELTPLLRKYDPGPELLTQRDFGTVELKPEAREKPGRTHSEVYDPYDDTLGSNWVPVREAPEPTTFRLRGLQSVFQLPDPLSHTWELENHSARHETVTVSAEAQPDFEMMDRMVLAANNFLADIGFELDPEEGTGEWEV